MDGSTGEVAGSLQLRLSLWLTLTIAFIAIIAGLASYFSAYSEAIEFQDDVLRQIASLYEKPGQPTPRIAQPDTSANRDEESAVFVQELGHARPRAAAARGGRALLLQVNLADGLQTVHSAGESYRVFVRTLRNGQRLAVAQGTVARDETARDSALLSVVPLVVLIPVLLAVVALLIRRSFRQVSLLAHELDRRSDSDLRPVAVASIPVELQPFARATNGLFLRVEAAALKQKRFVADAAHELRTPLTALSLQAERLAAADMSGEAAARLAALRLGIERGRSLLNQLLSLARAEAASASPAAMVSVRKVYYHVLEDLQMLAEAKGIDVGIVGAQDARVQVSEADLGMLVRNLVDNAIRYTPPAGRVDLSVATTHAGVVLAVEDTGPGIAPAERERVFDAFHRLPGNDEQGSGLGLAIVKALCTRLGARIELADADTASGSGLRVTVTFPAPLNARGPGGAWPTPG